MALIALSVAVMILAILILALLWGRGYFKGKVAAPDDGAGLFAEILPRAFVWGVGLALGFLVVEIPLAIFVGILFALLR